MKKYIFPFILLTVAVLFTACAEKDSEPWIAYYPAITLEGDTQLDWEAGVPFVDPGYIATLGGQDLTKDVKVETDLNYDNPAPGMYTIIYSVSSPDGYMAAAYRAVYVWDKSDAAAGYYTVSEESYRDYNGITYFGGYPEVIVGLGGGKYYVTDFFGGWYEHRAGYGDYYAMTGHISISENGTLTLLDSYVLGWGDSLDWLQNGKFDAATGTISWDVRYAGALIWHVEMTKKQ